MKQELIDNWKRTKAVLTEAQDAHMKSEYALYEDAKSDIPEKGTFHYGDIKIVTGFTEKWDQDAISKIYQAWDSDLKFPFKGEWKPDGKAISYIRENASGVYKKLSEALTLSPKKPAFSLSERE